MILIIMLILKFKILKGGKSDWRKFVTLPNILKEFNPKLIGFATGDSLSHQKSSQFNVAELGAMSMDLSFMVRELVKRIKRDHRVDFKNDWKVRIYYKYIILFIGLKTWSLFFS